MKNDSQSVLVVEDDLLAKKIACFFLTKAGFTLDITDSGKEAVEFAKTHDYKFILLDFGLHDMLGDSIAKAIRKNERAYKKSPCPIVVLSASVDKTQVKQCLEAGVNQVFLKPLTVEMIDKIKKVS